MGSVFFAGFGVGMFVMMLLSTWLHNRGCDRGDGKLSGRNVDDEPAHPRPMPRMPAYVCRYQCQDAAGGSEHCSDTCRIAHPDEQTNRE